MASRGWKGLRDHPQGVCLNLAKVTEYLKLKKN